ncbi:MAG: PorT family protein [Flavobacteriales bacterium]|nr:PorT family protein [Bacteroidota bacterium]MCB9241011.1 PorT family protein [Flavobacteriales bacterium]
MKFQRKSLVMLLLLLSTSQVIGQQWDYGLNANFNVSFIKPSVSDSLTNKSGFGGGIFLEYAKKNMALQLAPAYAYTSYINDNSLATTTIQSLDASLDFLYSPGTDRSIYFLAGITPGYTFSHIQKSLDGTKTSGTSSMSVSLTDQFDFAYKFGLSLPLNEGIRFNANYYEFQNGKQHNGRIDGRADYFQFGVQIRFKELSNSQPVTERIKSDSIALAVADYHLKQFQSKAPIIFVLPALSNYSIRYFTNAQNDSVREIRRQEIASLIDQRFADRPHRIIHSHELNQVMHQPNPFEEQTYTNWYYAQIGEFFLSDNENLKWGIFLSDKYMDRLKEPFEYYIPYRNIDTQFGNTSSVDQMLSELHHLIE